MLRRLHVIKNGVPDANVKAMMDLYPKDAKDTLAEFEEILAAAASTTIVK
jgi:hypothetical protein